MVPKWPAVKVVSLKRKLVYVRKSLLRRTFSSNFQLCRLAILDAFGFKLTSVAHLKALIILYWNLDGPEAWQNSYYGPCPLEKGHFTPKNGYCAVYSEYSCMTSDV